MAAEPAVVRALDLLIRLARCALDAERRRLAALEERAAALEAAVGAAAAERAREVGLVAAAGGRPAEGGGPLLAAWLEASRRREARLRTELAGLAATRAEAAARVRERHAEVRRHELLAERAARRAAAEAGRRERRELDDLVAMRHGRPGGRRPGG